MAKIYIHHGKDILRSPGKLVTTQTKTSHIGRHVDWTPETVPYTKSKQKLHKKQNTNYKYGTLHDISLMNGKQ